MSNSRLSPEEQKKFIEHCKRALDASIARLRAAGHMVRDLRGLDGDAYTVTFPLTNAQRSPTPQPDDSQDPGEDDEADEPETED